MEYGKELITIGFEHPLPGVMDAGEAKHEIFATHPVPVIEPLVIHLKVRHPEDTVEV